MPTKAAAKAATTEDAVFFHDFDADLKAQSKKPVRFKLGMSEFECIYPIPVGGVILALRRAAARGLDDVTDAESLDMLWSWIKPEQHEAFDQAVAGLTDITVFQKIIGFILASSAGRPTTGL